MSVGLASSKRILTVAAVFAVSFLLLVSYHTQYFSQFRRYRPAISEEFKQNPVLLDNRGQFWQKFRADLEQYAPKAKPVVHPEDTHLDIFFNASNHRDRPNILKMTQSQVDAVQESHTSFLHKLKQREYTLPYKAGTRGIVTTAGGPYLVVALVSIRMLRQTGSTLPVEVWLATWDEFDPEICGSILPSLNAQCKVLQDVFDYGFNDQKQNVDIHKYQYKVMSILFSSFEEVLFLDSDCFPIFDPTELFDSEPFTSTGLVLWPDFWYPSESPLFFEIAGISPSSVPLLWKQPATESGEILYSKGKHDHDLSIMLAAYYNYYGPEFFYPLQSQGAPGEGDKETFLWSAIALNNPYYSVHSPVRALGYKTKDNQWRGSAMLQHDPIIDLALAKPNEAKIPPRPMFIHANFPKLDPGQIFLEKSFGATGPTKDSDGTMRRIWHDDEATSITTYGFDLERHLWREIKDIACTYEGVFQSWNGVADICTNATRYWDAIFGGAGEEERDDKEEMKKGLAVKTKADFPA